MTKSKKTITKRRLFSLVIPIVAVIVWLSLAGIGGPYFGKINQVATNDLASFLPNNAEATAVSNQLERFQDSSYTPLITVFSSNNKLSEKEQGSVVKTVEAIEAANLAVDTISPPVLSEDSKAQLVVIPLDSDSEFDEAIKDIRALIDNQQLSVDYKFTGPAMFARDLNKAFAGIDGTLLLVALSVVFVILLAVYRSPILPILTLAGALAALAVSVLVVWHLANAGWVDINGQVQGILFILVIGATTDYSLLYIARYREELSLVADKWQATKRTWRASVEPILAAGGTVILGLMCLLVSDLSSNKALGPVGSLGIMFAMLSALTFLPAGLLLLGRNSFWPSRPKLCSKTDTNKPTHAFWRWVAGLVSRHPRRTWIGVSAILIVASLGFTQIHAEGVSQENLILGPSEARDGQEILKRHFPSGSGAPAIVLTTADQRNQVVEILDGDSGVDGVTVMSTDSDMSQLPIGKQAVSVKQSIKEEIAIKRQSELDKLRSQIDSQMIGAPEPVLEHAYRQASANIPSVDEMAEKADPFKDVEQKVIDNRVILSATLVDAPTSTEARQTIDRLRAKISDSQLDAKVGGVSAIQLDTKTGADRDIRLIIPLILISITIVLMILLRAIVLPLVLMVINILSFLATLGVAAFMFNHVWHFPGADPSVIVYAFVFLVALGIDYTIFLMTRVREETIKSELRPGTLKALVATGGVITSAGIVLAATFAALYVIPILFLAQIAFIVAFGVLLDTMIVRSLLAPALTLEIGPKVWWPSKLAKQKTAKKK